MSEKRRSARHGKKQSTLQKVVPFLIGAAVILIAAGSLYGVLQMKNGGASANKTGSAQVRTKEAKKNPQQTGGSKEPNTEQSSGASSETTESTADSADKQEGTLLAKGKNHNQAAQEYAYDPKWIQDVIDGRAVNDGQRICILTFDDGVNHEVTPKILDILKQEKVPATFFVVGKTLGKETKDLLEREIAEGHSVAIHSFDHDYGKLYPGGAADPDRIAQEAEATQKLLQELLGQDFRTQAWRYPGGHMSWHNISAGDVALAAQGLHWVDWNAMSGDAEPESSRPKTAAEMVAYQEKSITEYPDVKLRVVLMHDAADKQLTVEALPQIIQFYRDKGFKFGVLE